jgi:hypothetical protein
MHYDRCSLRNKLKDSDTLLESYLVSISPDLSQLGRLPLDLVRFQKQKRSQQHMASPLQVSGITQLRDRSSL